MAAKRQASKMGCKNIIGSCRRAYTCKGRLALKVRFPNRYEHLNIMQKREDIIYKSEK